MQRECIDLPPNSAPAAGLPTMAIEQSISLRCLWMGLIPIFKKNDIFQMKRYFEIEVWWLYLTISALISGRVEPRFWRLVWPDLAKFHSFDIMLTIFGHFERVHLIFGKNFKLIWLILYDIGQIFKDVISTTIEQTIWSHWRRRSTCTKGSYCCTVAGLVI